MVRVTTSQPVPSADGNQKLALWTALRSPLSIARAAVVASGTATLETALIGTPFVMVYRVSPLSWTLGRPLVKVDRFAMPNLIAGHDVVPELVQNKFTAEAIVAELQKILPDGPDRQRMIDGLAEVRAKLHPQEPGITASDRAAEAVLHVWPVQKSRSVQAECQKIVTK